MQLSISIKKTIYWLFAVILVVNGFSLFLRYLNHFVGLEINKGFLREFDTEEEANITTWFSTMFLLIDGALLLLIARVKTHSADAYARHWNVMAWIFFFLSMDEAAMIHEQLIAPLRNATHAGGIFYFAWVIVYIPLVILFVLLYLRFLFSLPRKTAFQFVVAGALYISGAVGFEMLGGIFHEGSVIYRALTSMEETFENLGSGLFIISLLMYAKSNLGSGPVIFEIRD